MISKHNQQRIYNNKSLLFIFALSYILSSCNFGGETSYADTKLLITNQTSDTLRVVTTATVKSPPDVNDDYEKTLEDVLAPGDTILMRNIKTGKNFKIRGGAFNQMTIYRHQDVNANDPLENEVWTKTLDTLNKKEYVLVIDSTFFIWK